MHDPRSSGHESVLVITNVACLELEVEVAFVRLDEIVLGGVCFGAREQAYDAERPRMTRCLARRLVLARVVKVFQVVLARPEAVLRTSFEYDY